MPLAISANRRQGRRRSPPSDTIPHRSKTLRPAGGLLSRDRHGTDVACDTSRPGEVTEWPIVRHWKCRVLGNRDRGFESPPLRLFLRSLLETAVLTEVRASGFGRFQPLEQRVGHVPLDRLSSRFHGTGASRSAPRGGPARIGWVTKSQDDFIIHVRAGVTVVRQLRPHEVSSCRCATRPVLYGLGGPPRGLGEYLSNGSNPCQRSVRPSAPGSTCRSREAVKPTSKRH